jgi:hypothetical protein
VANDLLARYLESIDKGLLDYLDENEDLSVATTRRLRSYTSELLAGTITTTGLLAAWPPFFDLVSAFVMTYGSVDLEDLEEEAGFGPATEWENGEPPSGITRGYLLVLELELDLYGESATQG